MVMNLFLNNSQNIEIETKPENGTNEPGNELENED